MMTLECCGDVLVTALCCAADVIYVKMDIIATNLGDPAAELFASLHGFPGGIRPYLQTQLTKLFPDCNGCIMYLNSTRNRRVVVDCEGACYAWASAGHLGCNDGC